MLSNRDRQNGVCVCMCECVCVCVTVFVCVCVCVSFCPFVVAFTCTPKPPCFLHKVGVAAGLPAMFGGLKIQDSGTMTENSRKTTNYFHLGPQTVKTAMFATH
jgi:hypothetical protein